MNSEPFRFGWKMVGFDWFLAKNQSGCCRFDPCFLKARLCFYKVHREGVCSPETQQQRGKRNIAFRDTVPAPSVYFKRSFNEKIPWSQRFFLIFLRERDQEQAAKRRQRVAKATRREREKPLVTLASNLTFMQTTGSGSDPRALIG